MAEMADSKLRRKIPDLTEGLTGHFDDHHSIIVGRLLDRLAYTERAIAPVDAELGVRMKPYAGQLERLQTIPGVGLGTAQMFIADTGGDKSRFGTPERLAAWTGVARVFRVRGSTD